MIRTAVKYSMMHHVLWLFAGAMLFLGGCALGDLPTPQTTACPCTTVGESTPVRAPQINASGTCNEGDYLEMWLDYSNRAYSEFITLMNAAADQPPDHINREIGEMSTHQIEVSNLAVPDCAEQGQLFLIEGMDLALEVFREYARGELIDVRTHLWNAQARFDTFNRIRETLSLQVRPQQMETAHPSTQP